MSDPRSAERPRKPRVERVFELWLFRSRWLLAPIYLGLVVGMAALVAAFGVELTHEVHLLYDNMNPRTAIVMALSLVDLSLAANLMLIVIFSGYENFVSTIDGIDAADRPSWMGAIDFSALKLKLVASIVAISAVALLRAFVRLAEGDAALDNRTLVWLVSLHLVFLVSGVMLAVMDLISSRVRH